MSDIDTEVVDGLKVPDPRRRIREATIRGGRYSITSSARASSVAGTVRPSVWQFLC